MPIFKGAGVAIVTPMKDNLEVDYDEHWRPILIIRSTMVPMRLLSQVPPVKVQLYLRKSIKKL